MVYRNDLGVKKLLESTEVDKLFEGKDYDYGAIEATEHELEMLNKYNLLLTRFLIKKGIISIEEVVKMYADAQL